jgi:hypothetical protein
MMERRRTGPALLLLALWGLLPGVALAGPWSQHFYDSQGRRSPLDSIPPSGLPPSWTLTQPGSLMPGSVTNQITSVSLDPEAGTIRESYLQGDVEVGIPLVMTMAQYDVILTQRTEDRIWRQLTRTTRSVTRAAQARGGLFRVDLPVQLPKPIRAIVGNGAPNLEVSGSETITLGGQSDWTVSNGSQFTTERPRQSAFPSLEMKQDLQVNLTGSIGDKMKVDVDQSSNVTSSLDNKVKLRYEGDENDMVQSVELGNTNLSLAGANFRQEGLFGVKTVMKMGTVDLTAIASRQQGKSETARFSPSGEARNVQIADLSYIEHQYYFVADHAIAYSNLSVWKDDRNPTSATNLSQGLARLDPTADSSLTNPQYRGYFAQLTFGQDYDIITPYLTGTTGVQIPVIKLRIPLGDQEVLAVSYTETRSDGTVVQVGRTDQVADSTLGKRQGEIVLKLIKQDLTGEAIPRDADGRYIADTSVSPWYPTLGYELRNFYNLNAQNIDPQSLNLVIRKKDSYQQVDPDQIGGTPLIQMLGLDQRDKNGNLTPDGVIDPNFIDTANGIIFFPDLHPFDPDPSAGLTGFLGLDDPDRNKLREADSTYQANPKVYYYKTTDLSTDSRFYIDASFKSSQQGYYLGRTDILENSEQVKVDGILQRKGTDYNIDYTTGQLTFLKPPGPDQVITVDYSFAPGVGQVQRTLLGFSSSYNPSQNFGLSSSMIYESRGAAEQNPKLGEEPARSVIADLSSVGTIRPQFMTDLANLIPGVRTNQQSTLNLQGDVAVSLPNPNTQGEAYIDDMEGNKQTIDLSLGRPLWMWSSVPYADSSYSLESSMPVDHGTVWWYNPTGAGRGVKEHDLQPVLTDEEGGNAERTVLEVNVKPNGVAGSTTFTPSTWTGITQAISRLGDDYSKLRYLEIWVNDRRRRDHANTHGILHIDLGQMDEDAFWSQKDGPNGILDTEDKNFDTKLDATEDTGLDGVPDKEEPGYNSSANPDPNGDDYAYDANRAPNDYSHINGTEGNNKASLNGRPDTEDLNENNFLDRSNDYYEATLDLSDTAYVAVDVAQLYSGSKVVESEPENGWRLFRVPIGGDTFHAYGNPNWDNIKQVRIWLSGLEGNTSNNFNIQIGGIDLVGNQWLRQPILDPLKIASGVNIDVRSRNNKDDAGIYSAPYAVKNAVGGKATQREQSLALAYSNLSANDSVFAFKTVSGATGGLGYTQYRELRYYVHGDPADPMVASGDVRLVARFGADTVSYYEYSVPVQVGWQSVVLQMDQLSRLKDQPVPDSVRVRTATGPDGTMLTVVGNPSFTRVNRITFGVTVVPGAVGKANGEVWVDDLRLAGVRRDKGTRTNMVVQANFADVLALNGTYQTQDADFFQVGTGVNRGTGYNHKAYGLSTTFNFDRMFPRSGLQIPIRYVFQHTTDVPKFRVGSDVTLSGSRADLETSRSDNQSIDLSYRRAGTRNGWTRFTADALSGNMTYTRTGSVTPQSADSSWRFSTGLNYDLPIGGGGGLALLRRLRLKFLPENIGLGTVWTSQRTVSHARYIDQGDSSSLRADNQIRQLDLNGRVSYVPLSSVTLGADITSSRNMLFHQQGPFGWNKGTEVAHTQHLTLSYVPRWMTFLTPNLTLNGTYSETGGPERRLSPDDPLNIKDITNSGAARLTMLVPLSRLANQRVRRSAARDTTGTILGSVGRYLWGHLQDVSTTFTFDRNTTISRVTGSPGFAFKTGFTSLFAPNLGRLSNSNLLSNRRYGGTAHTGLRPLSAMTIDFEANQSLAYTDNGLYGSRRTYSFSWPDVTLRWLELQRPLGLQNEASSLALNAHYSFKVDETGPTGSHPDHRLETTNWAPLLGWQASFKNGVRADVNTAYMTSKDIDETAFGVTTTRSSLNHDIRLTKLFPASKGIKFPWSKKRVRLPNDLNLNLQVTIQNQKQETLNPYGYNIVNTDQQTLSISSGSSYNFTQSMTGGFNLGFSQTKDNKSLITTRHVNVAFTAQFRF